VKSCKEPSSSIYIRKKEEEEEERNRTAKAKKNVEVDDEAEVPIDPLEELKKGGGGFTTSFDTGNDDSELNLDNIDVEALGAMATSSGGMSSGVSAKPMAKVVKTSFDNRINTSLSSKPKANNKTTFRDFNWGKSEETDAKHNNSNTPKSKATTKNKSWGSDNEEEFDTDSHEESEGHAVTNNNHNHNGLTEPSSFFNPIVHQAKPVTQQRSPKQKSRNLAASERANVSRVVLNGGYEKQQQQRNYSLKQQQRKNYVHGVVQQRNPAENGYQIKNSLPSARETTQQAVAEYVTRQERHMSGGQQFIAGQGGSFEGQQRQLISRQGRSFEGGQQFVSGQSRSFEEQRRGTLAQQQNMVGKRIYVQHQNSAARQGERSVGSYTGQPSIARSVGSYPGQVSVVRSIGSRSGQQSGYNGSQPSNVEWKRGDGQGSIQSSLEWKDERGLSIESSVVGSRPVKEKGCGKYAVCYFFLLLAVGLAAGVFCYVYFFQNKLNGTTSFASPNVPANALNTGAPSMIPSIAPEEQMILSTKIPTFPPPTLEPTEQSLISGIIPDFENRPTRLPTSAMTFAPTDPSFFFPTTSPTLVLEYQATNAPSVNPTVTPTFKSSYVPTVIPTIMLPLSPIFKPTHIPSSFPTVGPTIKPSSLPTTTATIRPPSVSTITSSTKPSSKPSASLVILASNKPSKRPASANEDAFDITDVLEFYAPSTSPSTESV